MEKSADRSIVIVKWKKYCKDHSREVTTDSAKKSTTTAK